MADYGKRFNSNEFKQEGYFGPLNIPGTNDVATEYSMDVNIDGRNVQIPSIVPTLSQTELSLLLNSIKKGTSIPEDIAQKAIDHARLRIKSGLSPFWSIPQKQYPYPTFDIFKDTTDQNIFPSSLD